MSFYILFDLGMAVIFLLFGLYFYRSDGKAAMLLTGYNMKSEEERKAFDEVELCRNYGKSIMLWAAPFLIGAAIDCFFEGIGCLLAWASWVILFAAFLLKRSKLERNI